MNDLQTLPDEKTWGTEFNYAAWNAGTVATLCQVPWTSDYRDLVYFNSDAALNNYVESRPKKVFRNLTYSGFGVPIKLNIPFNEAQKYNYLKAFNPAQPIDGDFDKAFYYFILDVVRVNPSTTMIYIQVDVWQTFGRTTNFGNCYIEQGHIGIANENSFRNYGRDFLTVSEGLDVGGEYAITKQYSTRIARARNVAANGSTDSSDYNIMIVTTVKLDADPGTVDAPKLTTATGSEFQNLPNGSEIYVFYNRKTFMAFLEAYSDKPWITQGIISVTAIPNISRYDITKTNVKLHGSEIYVYKLQAGDLKRLKNGVAVNWRDEALLSFATKYRKLKKLLTYPYTVLELTTYSGQPLIIKPESWSDPHATVIESAHLAPPAQRITVYPYRYNAAVTSTVKSDNFGVSNDGGEFLDMATSISNFPTFSIVNNGYMSYLASNSNSIAYQHSSNDWSNQKALSGAENTANNATMGIKASGDQNTIGINAANAQTASANEFASSTAGINAVAGILGGAAMGPGGIASGAASAAMNGLSTNMGNDQRNRTTQIGNSASRAGNARAGQLSADLRDSNLAYAQMAANGDYQQAIAGVNAKTNDAKLTQPTSSGQMGGDAALLSTYQWGYDLKIKTISGAALAAVGDYMLRYGYSVNRFGRMPSNFQTMTNFTYWKLKEVYITSAQCPENLKQSLRGIFEKGVTVWSNPDNIGMINVYENEILEGIVL